MSAWQPIETAPKDGTSIDVWRVSLRLKGEPEGARETGVFWQKDASGTKTFSGGKWMMCATYEWYAAEDDYNRLTHWMPIPEPPTP